MRVGIIAIALIVAGTHAAAADDRITDDTAYKVPEGKLRVGLWKLQYGVNGIRGLEVGTYTLPYVTWAFDVKTANGQLKYQFFDTQRWTLSAGLGVAYVDLTGIDIDAKIVIVPVQLLIAARLNKRFTLGGGLMYTSISGEGSYNEDEATAFRGAVAVDNAQSWLSLMIGLSRGWSLYLEGRAVSSTEGAAQGDATFAVDDRTTVDVALTGKASIEEMKGSSALLAAQWSRERFRLRLGVGYGNYNIPVVNFIVPVATPFPEFDLFFVF